MTKANLWKPVLTTASLLAAPLTLLAGPLQRADLPADPPWVLHFDCDLLRSTTVGQYLQGELNKPEVQAKLAVFQALFDFDLQKQLHGITLYGAGPTPDEAVLLIYGDFDADRLLTLAKAAPDYQTTSHGQYLIHNWIDQSKTGKDGRHPRAFAALRSGRLIFGQREAAVATALDALNGAIPTLAATKNFPQLGLPGGAYAIQAAARRLDLRDSDPNAILFRLSKMVRLDIGEAQSQLTSALTLEANDEDVAQHMAAIAQGLLALIKLQNKPEATRFANAISVRQQGASVVATLSLPAADAVSMMKADAARKAAENPAKN